MEIAVRALHDEVPASPVHTRIAVDADGREHRTLTVFCSLQHRSVDVDGCMGCAHLLRHSADLAASDASITCSAPEPFAHGSVRAHSDSRLLGARPLSAYVAAGAVAGRVVVCAHALAGLNRLAQTMSNAAATGVVVIDEDGRPIATLSAAEVQSANASQLAGEVVHGAPYSLPESAPLSRAVMRMALGGARLVPLTGRDGVVVGLLSDLDALRWFARHEG